MASYLPITLTGDNLGHRHRQLNCLVNDIYHKGIYFSSIQDLPEKSALDHLFKIDLASKYRNVGYIIENLRHEDMLYVSRALKCFWLLDAEYSEIINPLHLENVLYLEMTATAVTKIKHWIELNLSDFERNKEFYHYYIKTSFDTGFKFLWKCSKDFILSEVLKGNILEQIQPHQLKLLIEKCPDVAKLFFDNLEDNVNLLEKYLNSEPKYYDALKPLLKVNGEIFLDITEKYFNRHRFRRFNSKITKFIMKRYKTRFEKKPELYTSLLLDIKTLAKHLNEEEIKDLVMKLARAKYLQHWFSYKNIEPLIKTLSNEERVPFKKQVFVDKILGNMVEDWPYKTPSSPELKDTGNRVFNDKEYDRRIFFHDYDDDIFPEMDFRLMKKKKKKMVLKRRSANWKNCEYAMVSVRKTSLDRLFDRYRFVGFEKTLFDLRKQLNVETLQHRQNIMLVLISKSGGRTESLEALLNFLITCHENEPEHLRATVVRSLVRRCSAWRLPQNVWELILKFGRGVGLDGGTSTVACKEGLHAVVIRNIMLNEEIDPAVWKAFMADFSSLNDYSLNISEKKQISTKLPELLIAAAQNEPNNAIDCLQNALDTLNAFRIPIYECPNIVAVISETAQNNNNAELLLRRLFDKRIARKELFKQNFLIIQNNASYCNALKHDVSVVAAGDTFETLIKSNKLAHDKFIKTLSFYFNEEDGLSSKYLSILKMHIRNEDVHKNKLARYIAILSGASLIDIMREFNDAPKKSASRRFAAAIRAHCHLARPLLNLNEFEWKTIGAKAISNRVLKCSAKNIDVNTQVLMSWNRTQKLALILSMRVGKEASLLQVIAEKRPRLAAKTMLQHLKTNKLDEDVWDIILPVITKLDATNKITDRLGKALSNTEIIPANKRAKYCMTVFEVFRKITKCDQGSVLSYIEHILPEIDQGFIESLIRRFFNEEFTYKNLSEKGYSYDSTVCVYMRIVAKFLMQCKTDIDQEVKWENIGKPFFNHFDEIWKSDYKKSDLIDYLDHFLLSLKYTRIFLDTEYVSCLPMFERIVNRLHSILPIHVYYDKYIRVHLSMLYCKSVRQSIKNNPCIFEDLPRNLNQAAEIVGRIFGKLIAHEVIDLSDKYFDSVRDIYKVELREYLHTYFEYGESRTILIITVVKSILEHEINKIHTLCEHIYDTDRHGWPDKERNEIFDALSTSKNIEVQFFLYAHLNPW